MANASSPATAPTHRRSWHNGIAALSSAGITAAAGLALTTKAGQIELVAVLLLFTTCAGVFAQIFDRPDHPEK